MVKWKRMKLNDLQIPDHREYGYEYLKDHDDHKEFTLGNILRDLDQYPWTEDLMNMNKNFGVDQELVGIVESSYNAGVVVNIPKNTEVSNTIKLDYQLSKDHPFLLDYNLILAEELSKVTLVMDYHSEEGVNNLFHNGVTKVIARPGAQVNIIKLQRIADSSYHFDSNVAVVEGDGQVNWYTIEVGSHLSATDFTTYLGERGSEGRVKSLFLGDGNRKLDLSYKMIHLGSHSNSDIQSHGALKDEAYSVFRGTLDIKKGAKKSVGSEGQTVLLLDKKVRSDALPVLLCEEDDVKANHAASAGQLEENKLYYLMSRGLSMAEAKKLIIEASFRPILDQIPASDIRNIVEEEIARRVVHG